MQQALHLNFTVQFIHGVFMYIFVCILHVFRNVTNKTYMFGLIFVCFRTTNIGVHFKEVIDSNCEKNIDRGCEPFPDVYGMCSCCAVRPPRYRNLCLQVAA